jgi:diguanylate cyclase (GGDEF)-like protein
LLATAPGRAGVRVATFEACAGGRIGAAGLRAVFVEVGRGGAATPRRLRALRDQLPGVPIIPVRFGGARRGAAGAVPLTPPLDPVLLGVLAALYRRLAEGGRRARLRRARARAPRGTLAALASVVRATGTELEPQRIIEVAMERVRGLVALRGWLFLQAEPEHGILTIERTGGEGMAGLRGRRIAFGDGIAGRAAQRRRPLHLPDLVPARDAGAAPDLPARIRAGSVVAVPLLSRGRVVGVVEVFGRAGGPRLEPAHARLLALLLEPVAVAIDNALLLKRSEELSITDDLTKLYNSRYLNATLRREVERSKRYRTPVSLIFLDLDGFKNVNDQYGHLWGSRTLVEVGQVLGGTVREIDIVARFGGDEFTVILPQTGPEGALTIAERIRQRIAETVFLESFGMRVRITASLGIASFPDHGRTKDELIARADQAMYVAKGRGKDGVALADAARPQPVPLQSAR